MKVTWRHQRKDAPMGRFGGGWRWVLGFKATSRCVVFELLFFSVRVERERKPETLYEALAVRRDGDVYWPGPGPGSERDEFDRDPSVEQTCLTDRALHPGDYQ